MEKQGLYEIYNFTGIDFNAILGFCLVFGVDLYVAK